MFDPSIIGVRPEVRRTYMSILQLTGKEVTMQVLRKTIFQIEADLNSERSSE